MFNNDGIMLVRGQSICQLKNYITFSQQKIISRSSDALMLHHTHTNLIFFYLLGDDSCTFGVLKLGVHKFSSGRHLTFSLDLNLLIMTLM